MSKTGKKSRDVQQHIAFDWLAENIRTLDATRGIIPFPQYPFLRELISALEENRILIVAKSRQMLATWTICAYTVYRLLHHKPGIYLLLSKGGRDTTELLKRMRVMISNLDEEYRERLTVKASEIICDNGGRIIALPATEDAVRMHSPTGVFWDEMAFTPYAEAIWTSAKPAIDSGGSFIGVSTPNGTDNIFYELFTDQKNGFGKHKMHYSRHPDRDGKWKREAQRGLSETKWKQEYEIDFDVLENRVYSEFAPDLHVLNKSYIWDKNKGRTLRGIDFGYRHPFIIWAQLSPDGILTVFDEWEGHNATIEDLAMAMHRIDKRHGIKETDVYRTGCDPAGAAKSDVGISPVERLLRQEIKLVYRSSEIMTGVDLVKSFLKDATGHVSLKFSPNVKRTLYHLHHYRWDSGIDKPLKDDEHDHAMDALRYMIINNFWCDRKSWTGAKVAGAQW
ncbi:MAG: hypothetical protein HN757_04350 [Calditrichaeota bacterium]|nr:hypothetical protein [Calditrichota bacterium]